MSYYELVLEDAEARIAVRAIIGGGEIGVGLILAGMWVAQGSKT